MLTEKLRTHNVSVYLYNLTTVEIQEMVSENLTSIEKSNKLSMFSVFSISAKQSDQLRRLLHGLLLYAQIIRTYTT